MRQTLLGQPLILAFKSSNLVTGKTVFSDMKILKDSVLVSNPTVTYSEIANGLYQLHYTPTSTGIYEVFIEGNIYYFEVVSKTINTILQDIFDGVLGSWQWNKLTGLLTAIRTNGSTLATYNIQDTPDAASKEKVS